MRAQWLAKHIGITCLAVMILFLSSGIHPLTSHDADFPIKAGQTAFSVTPKSQPGGDHCNICFASQLLGQCLLSALERPLVAESFCVHVLIGVKSEGSLIPGCAGNRGPPSAASVA